MTGSGFRHGEFPRHSTLIGGEITVFDEALAQGRIENERLESKRPVSAKQKKEKNCIIVIQSLIHS